ncbi:hypothetical protein AKJ57_01395 [candidate division MSBL1 archaeon SCGC-AAA259A05]|uniref:DUF5658 domain-containing protein n=1 Tax=candidate division MSBL1 archaeon SCGC-AAA259A05 TaxID=1698259 RepID=A0A133UB14_9EURY|nr:hypothetical protein AKJ57_01395 [candidate division MSBL1 archaeon SCGC-AAA259A05]
MEIKPKRWIGFLSIFPFLDMISTYLCANRALELGYSLEKIANVEADVLISSLWIFTGNIAFGVIVAFAISVSILIFILGYFPQTEGFKNEDQSPLLLIGAGISLRRLVLAVSNFGHYYSIKVLTIQSAWVGGLPLIICFIFALSITEGWITPEKYGF